jgi:hypothetical protein
MTILLIVLAIIYLFIGYLFGIFVYGLTQNTLAYRRYLFVLFLVGWLPIIIYANLSGWSWDKWRG